MVVDGVTRGGRAGARMVLEAYRLGFSGDPAIGSYAHELTIKEILEAAEPLAEAA